MIKIKIYIILVSFIFAFRAFSTPVLAAELPEVQQDKGLVIFYRLSNFKGKAIRFNLNYSEGSIGQLLSGTYLYKYCLVRKIRGLFSALVKPQAHDTKRSQLHCTS